MKQVQEKSILFDTMERLFTHDFYTFQHSARVADLLYKFGSHLGLPDVALNDLYELGTLHDIGKIQIPSQLLNKKGKLTEKERRLFSDHTIYGYEILKDYEFSTSFIDGVLYHHENYDGTGYPYKRIGEDIPLTASMLRIVDSFDAMTNDRSYQKAFSRERALNEIMRLRGKHYEPNLVDEFISMMGK